MFRVVVSDMNQERVLKTYRGKTFLYACMYMAWSTHVMLCSGHSDAVLAVAAHPSSQFIFITSSRVCRIPHVCKYSYWKYYTVQVNIMRASQERK